MEVIVLIMLILLFKKDISMLIKSIASAITDSIEDSKEDVNSKYKNYKKNNFQK